MRDHILGFPAIAQAVAEHHPVVRQSFVTLAAKRFSAEQQEERREFDGSWLKANNAKGIPPSAAIPALTDKGEPTADADGFIPWGGGERPVAALKAIAVRLRSGRTVSVYSPACEWRWAHNGHGSDIIAYKPL